MSVPVGYFKPIFDRVCDRYALSDDSRQAAWDACFTDHEGSLSMTVVGIYRAIDGTTPPYLPS